MDSRFFYILIEIFLLFFLQLIEIFLYLQSQTIIEIKNEVFRVSSENHCGRLEVQSRRR